MERKHVERVYGIKRVAYEIIRCIVFFFFFFCVQLQHGTGESIIIDVIFERGKSVRESSNTCTREYGWYWLVEEIYGDKIA